VRGLLVGFASLLLLAGCTDDSSPADQPSATTSTGESPATVGSGTGPDLALGPCSDELSDGFKCGRLTVPLDHSKPDGETLALPVIVQDGPDDAPIFLDLTGGPGQPGVIFAERVSERLGPALAGRRLVMFDQRGTGGTAIECPGLQTEMGWNDLITPSVAATDQCSDFLGEDRAFYATQDTVDDIDLLRQALGADTLTVDGTSYGTYVAEHYALSYPERVDHLVLDSVVPHEWTAEGTLQLPNVAGVRRVLRMVCRESRCDTDPLADIATLVKRGEDAPRLLNLMAVISVASGTDMSFVPDMLHLAVRGNRRFLDGWLGGVSEPPLPEEYSAGLHAATVCLDQQHQPWGGSDADQAVRAAAVRRVEAELTAAETYPFGPAAVVDQGLVAECEPWGETPPDEVSQDRMLPDVPTLILVGDHDLSTPWEWAKAEIRVTPHPQVLVVRGTGHSVQSHADEFPQVLRRLESFLAS